MLGSYLAFYVLYSMIREYNAYLNQTEIKITKELIREFNINYCIIAQTFDLNNVTEASRLKKYLFAWEIPVRFNTVEEIYEKVIGVSNNLFLNVLRMIVFKVDKLDIVINLLISLKKVKKLQLVRYFHWLIFVEWSDEVLTEEELLQVPFDCEFIIVHPNDRTSYKLVELYKLRNKTIKNEYGVWDEQHGLTATKLSLYRRRNNLNNTKFLFVTKNPDIWVCDTTRQCGHNEVLQDIALMSNFQVTPVTPSELKEVYNEEEGDAYNRMSYFQPPFNMYNQLAPLFRITVNWYIEDVVDTGQPEFFVEVFHPKLWFAIFLTTVLGTITYTILRMVLKKIAKLNC